MRAGGSHHLGPCSAVLVSVMCLFHVWLHSSVPSLHSTQYSSVYCAYFMYGFTLQSPHCIQRSTRQCIVLISCMASLFSPLIAFNAGLVSVFHAG